MTTTNTLVAMEEEDDFDDPMTPTPVKGLFNRYQGLRITAAGCIMPCTLNIFVYVLPNALIMLLWQEFFQVIIT